jgi:hypothetical protein
LKDIKKFATQIYEDIKMLPEIKENEIEQNDFNKSKEI